MIYSLLVMSSPASGHCAASAAQFALAAIKRGHSIHRVFFLDKGTSCGSAMAVFPQDEADPLQPWIELATGHGVELILCVSSALKQGMLDEHEAVRHDKNASSIHPAFTISGLGQLVDAGIASDRLISFGG